MAISIEHKILVKISHVVFELCEWTDRQTDRHTHHNTSCEVEMLGTPLKVNNSILSSGSVLAVGHCLSAMAATKLTPMAPSRLSRQPPRLQPLLRDFVLQWSRVHQFQLIFKRSGDGGGCVAGQI